MIESLVVGARRLTRRSRPVLACSVLLLVACESENARAVQHYIQAAEASKYTEQALTIVKARDDVRSLIQSHPYAEFDVDADIALADSDFPLFCPGEYMVTMYLAGKTGKDNRVIFVDVRSGATRRGRLTEREVDERARSAEEAEDVEHRLVRAEMCLDGRPAFVIPHDAIPHENN